MLFFLAMALTSESFITERAQVEKSHFYLSLNPGSVGAFLVAWGSSLGDSLILHFHTMSRHCDPGQPRDNNKELRKNCETTLFRV